MQPKITCMADSNESGSPRMAKLALALANDPRFEWKGYAELDVDLEFSVIRPMQIKTTDGNELNGPEFMQINPKIKFNVELKEPSDYIASALSPSGHLYNQVLSLRESGYPCMALITEEWSEVMKANKDSCMKRGASSQIAENYMRIKSFKKRAYLAGVRTFYPGDDSGFFDGDNVWKDLLELVYDVFEDGKMLAFRPRPANGERELAASCMMFSGIGPETMKNILIDYQLCFAPRNGYARPIEEIAGIGKKRAAMINPHVRMTYLNRVKA